MKNMIKIGAGVIVLMISSVIFTTKMSTDDYPQGSYNRTCQSCVYNKATNTLSCYCFAMNGTLRKTSASGCTSYKNSDGCLQCENEQETAKNVSCVDNSEYMSEPCSIAPITRSSGEYY